MAVAVVLRAKASGVTRLAIAILVSFLLTLYAEQASADGRRVALVIGVGAYESVPQLPNAINDATAIAEMFRAASFDVVTARTDVGNLAFKRAIRDFEDAAADSDIAVVFYAGHGIEIRETNYLIPTDAKLVNERDAEDEAISLDRIITALEPAKRLRLVILDACRDNPFGTKMKRRVASRAITAGLGKVEPAQTDTLIAYAAKEKSVANDGEGAHSPFTTALLASLTVPGLDVRLAFGRVRDDVLKATGRKQEPFVYGSLGGGTVALVPAKAEMTPAAVSTRNEIENAKSDYEIVERVGKKEAWEVFLNTHKSGIYADLARVQVAKLSGGASDAVVTRVLSDAPSGSFEPKLKVSPRVEPPPVEPVPKPSAAEQRAWDRLRSSADQAAIRKFIETYPNSLLLPDAQDRLDTLQRLAREREDALRLEREASRQRDEDEKQKKAAEIERKRLEREAVRQREEAERAKAAEALRQRAEAMAAAKQREAEERAKAAEIAAHKREEEEAGRLAAIAVRKREAEERAQVLAAERQKAEAETAARKREAEAAALAAEAAKVARETEERSKAQAAREQARTEKATDAQAKVAAEAVARAVAEARAAEERERAKAAEIAARQKEAEERTKAAEAERLKAAAESVATDRDDEQRALVAEAARRKAKAEAEAERRRAQAAAEAAAERQAERAQAAKRREAAESAREAAEEAASANRRRAAEATRRAADRQVERAAAVAEQRRRSAQQAKEATRARAAQARPAPAPRARAEARASAPPPRYSGGGGGGGGGGAAPMVGIGF